MSRIGQVLALAVIVTGACGGRTSVEGDADVDADDATASDGETDVEYDRCDGYEQPPYRYPGDGRECLEHGDCPSGQFCWLPGVSVCGFCPEPVSECATDEDCAPDICLEEPPLCSSCPTGSSYRCRPPCSSGSCGEEATCDGDTGRCVPIPCSGGYACPINQRCVGEGGDEHGCEVLDCTDHEDCDCGVCATGACYTGPGACSGPVG